MAKYTVAVAGATGYAGGEALRILAAHPDFDITGVAGHSSVGGSMAKHMPHIPQLANLVVEDTTPEVLNGHDVIILRTAALCFGASSPRSSIRMPWLWIWAPTIVSKSRPLGMSSTAAISMSIGPTACPQPSPAKPAHGSYTRQRAALPGAKRIAGPGCNVTATTLALQPGIAEGLVESQDIVAIWSSDTRVPARISSAPTCLPPRPCNPPCRIPWAASTATFPRSCRTSPTRPARARRNQRIHARLHADSRPHVPRHPRHRVRPHDGQGQGTER